MAWGRPTLRGTGVASALPAPWVNHGRRLAHPRRCRRALPVPIAIPPALDPGLSYPPRAELGRSRTNLKLPCLRRREPDAPGPTEPSAPVPHHLLTRSIRRHAVLCKLHELHADNRQPASPETATRHVTTVSGSQCWVAQPAAARLGQPARSQNPGRFGP